MPEKCAQCGKKLGKNSIEKGKKKFCSPECLKKAGSKAKDDNVCEFC